MNSIISSYLAEYLEINPEKTKTSILSGTVDLYGVKFKKNLFTTLNLPYLELEDGYVGKIHVNLSLPRFYLYPINIEVDKIYIKVKPKDVNQISEQDILKTFDIYKNKKLKQFEELMNIKFSLLLEDDKKNKKKDKKEKVTMVENIINNLHIKIQNVVLIYDDCISNPKYPITLGVTIKKIYIDSTSRDFTELKEEDKLSPLKHKKLSIESLNIFLDNINKEDILKNEKTGEISTKLKIKAEARKNLSEKEKKYLGDSVDFYLYCESEMQYYSKETDYHCYLLRELSPEIKLTLNEKYDDEKNKEPQMAGIIDIKTISLEVSNKQIKALTNTLNYISLKNFYQQTTIDNHFKKTEKVDNDLIKNYLEEYSQYYKAKYIDKYEKDSKKFFTNLQGLEKNLSLDSIIALREMGNDIINGMIEIGKLDKEIQTAKGGFFFRNKNSEEIDKLKAEREKKIKEQKELKIKNSTMNRFKGYLTGIMNNTDGDKSKEDKIIFVFMFIMNELDFVIKEEKKDEKNEKKMNKIFEINFIKFETQVIIKTISQFIKLSLYDMKFAQYLSKNQNYEKILFSQKISNEEQDPSQDISLILIEFEHNMKFPISPFKFKLNFGKQMFIIIDYYYLFYLYNLFLKHISALDLNNLTSFLEDKVTNIVKIGYDNLVKNRAIQEEKEENDKLFNLNVDISLTAPILLFPLYFRDVNNSQILFISLGILKIKSQLADIKDEKNIYDKYIVEFSNFIMKTIDFYDSVKMLNDDVGEKIIYKSSFDIDLENYIYQKPKKSHKNEDFSPLLININLNDIKFSLSEEQIIFLIKYLENFLRTSNEFEREKIMKNKLKKEKQLKAKEEKNKDKKEEPKKDDNKKNESKIKVNKEIKKNEKKEENKNELIEKKEEEKTSEEITTILKLSIKFGKVEFYLKKNLYNIKKINFLSFNFKESSLNLSMKSNGSMIMDISFGHFYLYDEEVKLSEIKEEIPIINPEFKYIVGTTLYDFKTPVGKKISFSEIYKYKENNLKESIKINLNLDAPNNTINIYITMCKLTLSPNFSTIFRVINFLNYYLDIYNQSITNIKFEQLQEQVNDVKKEKNEIIHNESQSININIQNEENESAPPIINQKLEKEEKIDESNILKSREKSNMSIFFSMEGINLLLPVDPDKINTYIIFMAIEMPVNYVLKSDAEFSYAASKLININYLMKKSQLTIYMKEGSFSIYDFKDNCILLNRKNKIFEDFSLSFLMNNNLDNNAKINRNDIKLYINKETEFSININQIIIFIDLLDKFNNFMKELNSSENQKITLNKKQEFTLDDEDFKRAITNSIIQAREKQEELDKIKKKESQKININNYIDIFTYEIGFSDVYIKFYDIIDGLYQSLFEFSIKNTEVEFLQNSNPQNSTNLMDYIKSAFSSNKKKLNTYDKDMLYMYFKVLTNIQVRSLNNYLNQWEYFIEPMNIEFYLCQILKKTRPIIELYTNDMLNINFSLNFAKILQFTIKKFFMNQEEMKKEKEETPGMSDITPNDTRRYIGYEAPILIIENYSGVDMDIWFDIIKNQDLNKDNILRIKHNEKCELTSESLKKFNVKKKNNNLNSTVSFKFCLEEKFMKEMNIYKNKIVGNNFNINYHHIEIHDITNTVKVSVESCSDNLLIHHVIFSSLITIKNETKYQDLEIINNNQKILLNNNKKESIPISWLLDKANRNINLGHEGDKKLLNRDMSDIPHINRVVKFNNGDVVMIDMIKYKFNLDEYYRNKNLVNKNEIYKVQIRITPPIHLINSTPYDFIINNNEKIISQQSIYSYHKNANLFLEYRQNINETDKKFKNNKMEIIMRIIKDIKLQIMYDNDIILADTYITEKEEEIEDEKNEEGKSINNFALYNKSLSILLKNVHSKQYLICRFILNNPYKTLSFDKKLYDEIKLELNSFRYEIIFDYYFINKTYNNLYFNNKYIDIVRASKENLFLKAKQFIPVSKILINNDKVKFRKTQKDWTDNLEISALGKEFVLNVKNENKTYNCLSLNAKVSTTFKKSITLIIEEKFFIINELPFDIFIKEEKLGTTYHYKSRQCCVFLLDKEALENKCTFRVGIDSCFSHIFDISKLGSYDLLIRYDRKTFEKYNINVGNKLVEYDSKKYYPIRCVINTLNKNTIYIIFSINHQYINQLKNCTPATIEVLVEENKKEKFVVNPEQIIPLVYIDKKGKYQPFENAEIIFDVLTRQKVKINEVDIKYCGSEEDNSNIEINKKGKEDKKSNKKKKKRKKNYKYFIRIRPEKNNSVKCITLFKRIDSRLGEEKEIKQRIKRFTGSSGAKITLELEGIGISLIDEKPKELFYLSFYKIFLNYSFSTHVNILNEINTYNSFTFSIKNLELDYCLENAYDLIFNPVNQILPAKPGEKIKSDKNFVDKVLEVGDEDTPFLQFVASQKTKQEKIDNKIKLIYSIYPELAIIIQEFDVRINTILINCIINLVTQYIKIFLPDDENNTEIASNKINKQNNILIEDDNEVIKEVINKLVNKGEDMANLIINILTLSAIKVNTTFKINKNAIDVKFIPDFATTILNTLCSTLTSFSDVTIKLSELTFLNVFSDFDSLFIKLYSFYKNKLLAQIYKIIFNMDIFGNPVNLVEGLGTGIFQFFNEPRKGLLKGPEEFGLGIARGARSLVSNIVGGGFNSVSKITGTLLNASKNISSLGTEEEVIIKEEDKPRGLLKGTLSGLKKGLGEITHGVTGIVTKPIEQTKKGGVGGFFKGLGSGLLGAVLSPVNTVLTVGNEVSSGISNSELISNKKSLRRFRLPRTLYKYIPISPYNEEEEIKRKKARKEIEGTDKINVSLSNEKLCLENSTEIILHKQLNDGKALLFTDVMIKILNKEWSKFIQKIYVCNIQGTKEKDKEVILVMKNSDDVYLVFQTINDKNEFIKQLKAHIN